MKEVGIRRIVVEGTSLVIVVFLIDPASRRREMRGILAICRKHV